MVDDLTLAAVAVLAFVVTAAVYQLGTAEAEERLGCGIVSLVDRTLSLDQPCH